MTKGTLYTILTRLLILIVFGAFIGIAVWAGELSQ